MNLNFSWDGEENIEIIIFRRILYDSPEEVIREYGEERLKEIFWKFWFKFDKRNLSFWKLILGISDDEFRKKLKEVLEKLSKSGIIDNF